jgi:serine phosphatase RsbU (regulator of sigma subunit)
MENGFNFATILLIALGIFLMGFSIRRSNQVLNLLRTSKDTTSWRQLVWMNGLFIFGYFGAIGLILSGERDILHLLTGTIFLGGAAFVFIVFRTAIRTYSNLNVQIEKREEMEVQVMEKARMEEELKTAAAIQQALLPRQMPEIEGISVAAFYRSASETGGDWYGFMDKPPRHLVVMIADVTGHGTPAALVTSATCATCKMLEESYSFKGNRREISPASILNQLNKVVYEIGHPSHLMTCFVGVLDLETGMLRFSNAGQTFPILLRAGSKPGRLLNTNPILGIKLESEFKENMLQLIKGDSLLFYTDGITENRNREEEEFGERRMMRLLENNKDLKAPDLVDLLIRENQKFLTDFPLEDDMTLVAVSIMESFPNLKKSSNSSFS